MKRNDIFLTAGVIIIAVIVIWLLLMWFPIS